MRKRDKPYRNLVQARIDDDTLKILDRMRKNTKTSVYLREMIERVIKEERP